VRLTSFQNVIWIMALVACSWISASAQTPPGAAQSPIANRGTSQPQPHQTIASDAAGWQAQSKSVEQTSTQGPQAVDSNSGQSEGRVETAGIFPDSASLLPVAALVGFSFLLGGIVCGSIKTRH
jgi:hypothetical protein